MSETIDTYNTAAVAYAEKFNAIGSREADVRRAFELYGPKTEPSVFEWGCGNGRDATCILKYTPHYTGIDASEKMIALARKQAPAARFEVADISSFPVLPHTDIVFGFASLLHLDKESVQELLKKTHQLLSDRGIIYLSLKRAPYEERVVTDEYGARTFYFYQRGDIEGILAGLYEVAAYEEQQLKGVNWFTIALRKK